MLQAPGLRLRVPRVLSVRGGHWAIIIGNGIRVPALGLRPIFKHVSGRYSIWLWRLGKSLLFRQVMKYVPLLTLRVILYYKVIFKFILRYLRYYYFIYPSSLEIQCIESPIMKFHEISLSWKRMRFGI